MAAKENKGGVLKNSQIEEDLAAKGRGQGGSYEGMQDTGDKKPAYHPHSGTDEDDSAQKAQQNEEA